MIANKDIEKSHNFCWSVIGCAMRFILFLLFALIRAIRVQCLPEKSALIGRIRPLFWESGASPIFIHSTNATPMKNVVAIVLGGGRGTRLMPLTSYRSKPAVPLAGKYRLIDIPISNCINSGVNHVYVLTQFLSVSLHQHIRGTYRFDAFSGGFVEILAAQQTIDSEEDSLKDWYQGTADAVRKNMRYFLQEGFDYVLILSGDQLYRMDFAKMMADHEQSGADVTIAAKPVSRAEASSLGIMRVDDSGRVVGFIEKPKTAAELADVAMDPAWIDAHGVESHGRDCLASMGIYLFSRQTLLDALEKTNYQDFGREVFPASIRSRKVQVHLFDGYWEDIGTIKSFFEANLQMAKPDPPFSLSSARSPIYTRPRFLPPTRCDDAVIKSSLVADGCVIEPGADYREQHRGFALPNWSGSGDSQHGADGRRLLRTAQRCAAQHGRRHPADRHRRRHGDRRRDCRQELSHRRERADRQRRRPPRARFLRRMRHSRWHFGGAEARGDPHRLAVGRVAK